MKIDIGNGRLTFESGSIGPQLSRRAFLETSLATKSRFLGANDGWVRLGFDPEPGIGVTAYFKDDRLKHVDFGFSMPGDDKNNWTQDRENERKARHDAWLRTALGEPPYRYGWGQIVSVIDAKTCDSLIFITYD